MLDVTMQDHTIRVGEQGLIEVTSTKTDQCILGWSRKDLGQSLHLSYHKLNHQRFNVLLCKNPNRKPCILPPLSLLLLKLFFPKFFFLSIQILVLSYSQCLKWYVFKLIFSTESICSKKMCMYKHMCVCMYMHIHEHSCALTYKIKVAPL